MSWCYCQKCESPTPHDSGGCMSCRTAALQTKVKVFMWCPRCNSSTEHDSYGCCKQCASQPLRRPHKCPVCDGTGKVSRPPHIAGDVPEWADGGTGPYPCQACQGTGIIWDDQRSPPWGPWTLTADTSSAVISSEFSPWTKHE